MSQTNNPSDAEKEAAAKAAAEQEAAAKGKKADKAEPKAKTPAWQLPDYAGPLDINQAQWRLRNIKPVAEPQKK